MAIASQKFWDRYPEARVERAGETIPYVDFSIIYRILFAAGRVWKGDVPTLTQQDRLYVKCSDDPNANVMRYEGKWYALTVPDARELWKEVDFDGPAVASGE